VGQVHVDGVPSTATLEGRFLGELRRSHYICRRLALVNIQVTMFIYFILQLLDEHLLFVKL
jgi:hypothetical protein